MDLVNRTKVLSRRTGTYVMMTFFMIMIFLYASGVFAGPEGAQVINGQVSFQQSGLNIAEIIRQECKKRKISPEELKMGRRERIFSCQGSCYETFSYNSPNKREAHLRDMAADCFYGF